RDEGTLFLVLEGEDEQQKTGWAVWQLEAGLPLEMLTRDSLRELEPGVTDSASGAIFLPAEHQVENRWLMDALEVATRRAGVEMVEDAEGSAVTVERNKVKGIVSSGRVVDSGAVVIAAGTWSGRLLEPLGLNVEVIPARGQMIAIRGQERSINCVVHSSDVYL